MTELANCRNACVYGCFARCDGLASERGIVELSRCYMTENEPIEAVNYP